VPKPSRVPQGDSLETLGVKLVNTHFIFFMFSYFRFINTHLFMISLCTLNGQYFCQIDLHHAFYHFYYSIYACIYNWTYLTFSFITTILLNKLFFVQTFNDNYYFYIKQNSRNSNNQTTSFITIKNFSHASIYRLLKYSISPLTPNDQATIF